MLIAFVIQVVLDVYLLRCVWALHRRSQVLRESASLHLQAAELMSKILQNHENQLRELESVQ